MKANLYFHPGTRLRVVKGPIATDSGSPPTIYVTSYSPGTGRCNVLIVESDKSKQWEETWDLVKPHGAEGATFMRGEEGGFSNIEVAVKKDS